MFRVNVPCGHPRNPDEFERYEFEKHVPLAMKIPRLMGLTAGQALALTMGERALGTPEGQAATSDLANFASGGTTVFADEEQVAIPVTLPATIG